MTDTVMDRRAPVLEYGTSTVVGEFGCNSTRAAIDCYHLTGVHGFFLSRQHHVFF